MALDAGDLLLVALTSESALASGDVGVEGLGDGEDCVIATGVLAILGVAGAVAVVGLALVALDATGPLGRAA